MTDPNVQTTASGEEVILEPGDPGYVDPNAPQVEPGSTPNPVPDTAVESPAGADLQHVRQPGESDAEFMARTRNVAVVSQSPTDIVPNTPQITMGQQVEVGEGLVTGVPPETLEEEEVVEEPGTEPVVEDPTP